MPLRRFLHSASTAQDMSRHVAVHGALRAKVHPQIQHVSVRLNFPPCPRSKQITNLVFAFCRGRHTKLILRKMVKDDDIREIFTNCLNINFGTELEIESRKKGLSEFLVKIPGFLKKYSCIFIRKKSDSDKILLKKKRFVLWLIHKLLCIRAQKLRSAGIEEVHKSCLKNIAFLLKIAGLQDPKLFCLIVEKYLILLQGKHSSVS